MSTTTFTLAGLTTSTVRFDLGVFDLTGLGGFALLDGPWIFTPSRRLQASSRVVVPREAVWEPTSADLAVGYFVLNLPATDTGEYGAAWAWTVREPRPGGITRTVFIPTSTATLEYAALPSVDPTTLSPLATPVPAWTAALDQATARISALETGDVSHAQLIAVTDEIAQVDNAVGELAGQTMTRLNAKVDSATYSAFHDVVVQLNTTMAGQITTLQGQVTALQVALSSLSGQVTSNSGGVDGGAATTALPTTYDGGSATG